MLIFIIFHSYLSCAQIHFRVSRGLLTTLAGYFSPLGGSLHVAFAIFMSISQWFRIESRFSQKFDGRPIGRLAANELVKNWRCVDSFKRFLAWIIFKKYYFSILMFKVQFKIRLYLKNSQTSSWKRIWRKTDPTCMKNEVMIMSTPMIEN